MSRCIDQLISLLPSVHPYDTFERTHERLHRDAWVEVARRLDALEVLVAQLRCTRSDDRANSLAATQNRKTQR